MLTHFQIKNKLSKLTPMIINSSKFILTSKKYSSNNFNNNGNLKTSNEFEAQDTIDDLMGHNNIKSNFNMNNQYNSNQNTQNYPYQNNYQNQMQNKKRTRISFLRDGMIVSFYLRRVKLEYLFI